MTPKAYQLTPNSTTKPLGLAKERKLFLRKAREAHGDRRSYRQDWLGCADLCYRLDRNKPVGRERRRRKSSAGRRAG